MTMKVRVTSPSSYTQAELEAVSCQRTVFKYLTQGHRYHRIDNIGSLSNREVCNSIISAERHLLLAPLLCHPHALRSRELNQIAPSCWRPYNAASCLPRHLKCFWPRRPLVCERCGPPIPNWNVIDSVTISLKKQAEKTIIRACRVFA